MKDDDIPDEIPEITRDRDGEPQIVRQQVVQPNPMPRFVSFIILIMVLATTAYVFVKEEQRDGEQRKQHAIDQVQDDAQNRALDQLKDLQLQADRERENLRALIVGILSARSDEERRRLLEAFAKNEGTSPRASTSVTPRRSPTAAPRSSEARPRSQSSPRASPSRSPSPSPSRGPGVTGTCVETPITGRICP